ncbi:MAG: hypothetical protein AAGJ37_00515 [Pseudomonadota bacterium]
MQDKPTLTTEQQYHRSASALSRKLYHIEQRLETVQDSLAYPDDGHTMMKAGIELNAAVNDIRNIASRLYQSKKALETQYPALAQEAKEYGEKMKTQREQGQQTSQTQQF